MQTFKPVKSKIKTTYQQSSIIRKSKLINVLPSYRISEINKCLRKNVTLHLALFNFKFSVAIFHAFSCQITPAICIKIHLYIQ